MDTLKIDVYRNNEKMESNLHITMVSNFPHLTGKKTGKFGLADLRRLLTENNWDNDMKLDNLLPKLQGRAGDFVFTQLPKYTLK